MENVLYLCTRVKEEQIMKTIDNIVSLVEKNYKGVSIPANGIELSGDYLVIKAYGLRSNKMPFVALRILRKFPEIRLVHFTGGWTESVYTRETLKWAGYKNI